MQRILIYGLLLSALGAAVGCGNKGPLYLPSTPAEPQQLTPEDTTQQEKSSSEAR